MDDMKRLASVREAIAATSAYTARNAKRRSNFATPGRSLPGPASFRTCSEPPYRQ